MFICTWSVSLSDLLFWLSKAILVSDNCRNESLQAVCQKRQKQIHSGNKWQEECWEFSLTGINVRHPVVKGLITFDHAGGRLLLVDCIIPPPFQFGKGTLSSQKVIVSNKDKLSPLLLTEMSSKSPLTHRMRHIIGGFYTIKSIIKAVIKNNENTASCNVSFLNL